MPLVREIAWRDPAIVFAPFAGRPGSMLLDSPGSPATGRHAFIAVEPFQWLKSKGEVVELDGRRVRGNPFAILRRELGRFSLQADPTLPPLQGGVVGCFGYELARHLERLPTAAGDDRRFPDLALGFYDVIVAFDGARQRAWILSSGHPEAEPTARRQRAAARLEAIETQFASTAESRPPAAPQTQPEIVANFTRAAYEAAVQRVIDYILAGDIFQANLSQRFDAALPEPMTPWDLYRRLRAGNPADFAAYLAFGDLVIASASPERFLRLSGDRVETWPIKGTRPRGATPAEDAALAAALLASEKDRAENVMIVDLLRNDLSRVCRDGSIEVPSLCRLETLPTVFHLVSTVTGRLRSGLGPVDLLEACFPGGSITGAPKIRAMEIIAELEPTRRGPYCGTIGYIGFDGAMDSSIVIRTFAVKDRRVTFQTGGGIVADSSPAEEYDETLAKARALIAALSPASAGR